MLFGQIGFLCPVDGQVQAGFDCVEDMIVHEEGRTEISVRCPKCDTLVRIASHVPIIPPQVIEQLAQELSITMQDGKLNFSDLIGQVAGVSGSFGFGADDDSCGSCSGHDVPDLADMADRKLSTAEGNQVEFFARELEKIESVDEFLMRANETS